MKCVLRKTDLESIVTKAARATDSKSPALAMRNVVLEARGTRVRASGCDLYVAWEGDTDAAVEKPGATTVPAEELVEKVKALPDGPVSVELDGARLAIKAKNRKHYLPTLSADDYPKFPADKTEPKVFEISARVLKSALDRVWRVIDKKAAAQMACVHLWAENQILNVVVVHVHRYHWQSIPMSGIPDITQPTMIPPKAVEDLRALLTADEKVFVTVAKTWMSVRAESGHTYRTRLQLWEHEIPFHRTIEAIRRTLKHPVKVPRALALEAFKACASDRGHLELYFKPGRIVCEAPDEDGRLSQDEIPIEYSGPERSITIEQRYADELFQAAPDSFVEFESHHIPDGMQFKEAGATELRVANMQNGGIAVAVVLRSGDFEGFIMGIG